MTKGLEEGLEEAKKLVDSAREKFQAKSKEKFFAERKLKQLQIAYKINIQLTTEALKVVEGRIAEFRPQFEEVNLEIENGLEAKRLKEYLEEEKRKLSSGSGVSNLRQEIEKLDKEVNSLETEYDELVKKLNLVQGQVQSAKAASKEPKEDSQTPTNVEQTVTNGAKDITQTASDDELVKKLDLGQGQVQFTKAASKEPKEDSQTPTNVEQTVTNGAKDITQTASDDELVKKLDLGQGQVQFTKAASKEPKEDSQTPTNVEQILISIAEHIKDIFDLVIDLVRGQVQFAKAASKEPKEDSKTPTNVEQTLTSIAEHIKDISDLVRQIDLMQLQPQVQKDILDFVQKINLVQAQLAKAASKEPKEDSQTPTNVEQTVKEILDLLQAQFAKAASKEPKEDSQTPTNVEQTVTNGAKDITQTASDTANKAKQTGISIFSHLRSFFARIWDSIMKFFSNDSNLPGTKIVSVSYSFSQIEDMPKTHNVTNNKSTPAVQSKS